MTVTSLPPVSVVICVYTSERWRIFRQAVGAVTAQQPGELIIVVDHNPELLERTQTAFDRARVVPNSHRRGLAGARNVGVEAAHGDIVVFLDDDAVPLPGWLAALTAPFADPAVLGVGGAVRPWWAKERPRWFPDEFLWVVGCSYRGLPQTRAPIRNPIGASMAYRRSVLMEVGGFDTALGRVGKHPVGCEETELAIRAARRYPDGLHLYEPSAVVRHRVPAERATCSYFLRRCYAEGQSKAQVTRRTDGHVVLTTERAYTRRVLPSALLRSARAALRGDMRMAGRAAAVTLGLLATVAGYTWGRGRRPDVARPRKTGSLGMAVWRRTPAAGQAAARWLARHAPGRYPRWGNLRRREPFSAHYGYDRGTPIDRHYIESFLHRCRADVSGRVLEVKDATYAQRYGSRLDRVDVVDIDPANRQATLVADLCQVGSLPAARFDCVILTQTLHLLPEPLEALVNLRQALAPGGVLLITVPTLSRTVRAAEGPDYWRWTPVGLRQLLSGVWPDAEIKAEGHGNLVVALGSLLGLAGEELDTAELDCQDPAFPVVVTARVHVSS
ncbi:MAG: glycosyltransferase [Egibacteraceae bacterium]